MIQQEKKKYKILQTTRGTEEIVCECVRARARTRIPPYENW